MRDLEDASLVERTLAGEREAFALLLERHAERVYSLCYALLRHPQDAEDACQETFLRAYRALGRFDRRYGFAGWLLKIAANHCRDRLRRRRRLPGLERLNGRGESIASPPADPARHRRDALLNAVRRALDLLPPVYREVFHLYHREGLSYAEMAEVLGRPVGTIKTQLHRARRRLCELVRRSVPQEEYADVPEGLSTLR